MEENKMDKSIVGKHIRLKRIEKSLTIQELAFGSNLDDKHVGKVERGDRFPGFQMLYKLYKYQNISIDLLFEEIQKELDS